MTVLTRCWKLPLLLAMCALLSACWDEVMIQDQLYITALGADYNAKSKQYEMYAHIVDITYSAKQAQGGSSEGKSRSYVGRAKGTSPQLALNRLFQTVQMQPNIDHVMSLVVSESAMPRITDLLDGLNRIKASRYTLHLMGTSDPLDRLFETSELVGKSPLNTDIYQPDSNRTNRPFDGNWDLLRMARAMSHGGGISYVPRMASAPDHWETIRSKLDLPVFSGAFVLKGAEYQGVFTEDELAGARWFRGESGNLLIPLVEGSRTIGALRVKKTYSRIRYSGNGRPSFRLSLKVRTALTELLVEKSQHELERMAEQAIREQIEKTRRIAASQGADLFGLEEAVYRRHMKSWQSLKKDGTKFESLPFKADVRVRLMNTGKLKLKRR